MREVVKTNFRSIFPLSLRGRDYLTASENKRFRRLLDSGIVSFFRTGNCKACGSEIPSCEGLVYCSLSCKDGEKEGEEDNESE